VEEIRKKGHMSRVGQNHTYIRIYGDFSREITLHTVIYGVHIRFWPTLHMRQLVDMCICDPITCISKGSGFVYRRGKRRFHAFRMK